MANIILSTKLKNEIVKIFATKGLDPKTVECNFRNINVNGDKRGCSGVVKFHSLGLKIYVNTENTSFYGSPQRALVRFCDYNDDNDTVSGQNYFFESNNTHQFATKVVDFVMNNYYRHGAYYFGKVEK